MVLAPLLTARCSNGTAAESCFWGIQNTSNLDPGYWDDLTALERRLGRTFAAFRRNGISDPSDLAAYRQSYDHGAHWGYVNGKFQDQTNGFWRQTAAGAYDQLYLDWFRAQRADPRWTRTNPLHVSFHHEQAVASEGGGLDAGSPQDFAAAYRHWRELMQRSGAHHSAGGNLAAAWVPHWKQFADRSSPMPAAECDPGPEHYDLVGADIYSPAGETHTAASQWTPVRDYARRVGKPFIAGEAGVAGSDSKVVGYLDDLDDLLRGFGAGTGAGQIQAICWTSRVAESGDYRLDATAARLGRYRRMGNAAFYGATI